MISKINHQQTPFLTVEDLKAKTLISRKTTESTANSFPDILSDIEDLRAMALASKKK